MSSGTPQPASPTTHRPGPGRIGLFTVARGGTGGDQYENKVYVLPKHLDEKVAYIGAEKRPVQKRRVSVLM